MESIGLRSSYDSEWDHGGYRDPTPQFQVLMRQSSKRRCCSKKLCCILFVLLSLLGILLTGALIYIFVLKDPLMIFGASHNSTVIKNNQTNNSITLLTTTKESTFSVTSTTLASLKTGKNECPSITGFGNDDMVTALFGGVNENGQAVTSIELIPKRNCPSLPRS